MKTRIILLSMTLSLTALSCTNKLSDRLEWDQGLMAAIPGYETVNATRVSFPMRSPVSIGVTVIASVFVEVRQLPTGRRRLLF